MSMDELKATLRCVLQSCKGGVPLHRLDKEYKMVVGEFIPVRTLGFSDLEGFLRSIPDVAKITRNNQGETVVMDVPDESTAHISRLVRGQNAGKKRSKPARGRFNSSRRGGGGGSYRQNYSPRLSIDDLGPPSNCNKMASVVTTTSKYSNNYQTRGASNSVMTSRTNRQSSRPSQTQRTELPPRFQRQREGYNNTSDTFSNSNGGQSSRNTPSPPSYSTSSAARLRNGAGDGPGVRPIVQPSAIEKMKVLLLQNPNPVRTARKKVEEESGKSIEMLKVYCQSHDLQSIYRGIPINTESKKEYVCTLIITDAHKQEQKFIGRSSKSGPNAQEMAAESALQAFCGQPQETDYKEKLASYCQIHHIAVIYKTLEYHRLEKNSFSGIAILQKANLEELRVATYPDNRNTPEEAEQLVAKKALEALESGIEFQSSAAAPIIPSSHVATIPPPVATPANITSVQIPPQPPVLPTSPSAPQTNKERLTALCTSQGWRVEFRGRNAFNDVGQPEYSCAAIIKKTGGEDENYSTFRTPLPTTQQAEELAAQIALEAVEAKLEILKLDIADDWPEIGKRLAEIISTYVRGLWASSVPALYSETYKKRLPNNWMDEISQRYGKFFTFDNSIGNRYIVYPGAPWAPEPLQTISEEPSQTATSACISNGPPLDEMPYVATANEQPPFVPPTSELQNVPAASEQSSDDQDGIDDASSCSVSSLLGQPELPAEAHWSVIVTYFTSTVDVTIRISAEEFSDKYFDFCQEMEKHYEEHPNLVVDSDVTIGGVYVNQGDEGGFFRVEVLDIRPGEALCLFVDNGDSAWVPNTTLHHIETSFTEFPVQAIRCQLEGLQVFSEICTNDQAIIKIMETIMGKILIAEVVSRDELPSLILHDTSGEEDINITNQLFTILVDLAEPARAPTPGIPEHSFLTYISTTGDLYFQTETVSYRLFNALMDAFNNKLEEYPSVSRVEVAQVYIAKYAVDDKWYRAKSMESSSEDSAQVYFMDFGNVEVVPLADIRNLAEICPALAGFPEQAFCCTMFTDRVWTTAAVEKLRTITPYDQQLLVKTAPGPVAEGELPRVEIFKRVDVTNELISINATLENEPELFGELVPEVASNNSTSRSRPLTPPNVQKTTLTKRCSLTLSGPSIPDVGEEFDIQVTLAANPSNFMCQSYREADRLDVLMGQLGKYYAEEVNRQSVEVIRSGQFYATMYDEVWYRCQAKDVIDVEPQQTSVQLVDYGDLIMVSSSQLKILPDEFRILPYQAIKAKLYGVEPLHLDWSPEDCFRFQEIVANRQFVSIVKLKGLDPSGVPLITLRLIDTSDSVNDVYVDKILVQENRANISVDAR